MFSRYLILEQASILDALKTINSMERNEALTLFVKDVEGRIIGTLTDGDVRRSLIDGKDLSTSVVEVANCNFSYLNASSYDVRQIHAAKEKGIELLPVLNDQMQIVDVVNLKKQKSYLPVDAVLMAGGKGERLRPLTEKIPKPLLKVGEKCIIDYNVDRLISFGLKHISVTINYLKEQIEEHFASPIHGVQVNTVREPYFLGTMGSIQYVESFHNDTVLVMNSDLFTDIDYEDFFIHYKQHDADMSVAAVPYTVSVPYGIMDLNGRNIKGMIEKPRYNYYANAGIYLIKRELLDMIPKGVFYNATDLIDDLVKIGKTVIRYPINGTWIDIGNPQEYQKAQDLASHIKY